VRVLVQLHFKESRIRNIIKRSRDELGDYWGHLAEFYYNLLTDAVVSSISTCYSYMFHRWLKARDAMPEEVDDDVLKGYVRK